VYVTGSSINGATSSDYITAKFDASGNRLWSARYNSPDSGYDSPTAIVVDESGYVYVTGSSRRGYYGDLTYATVKYSPDGIELWTARYQSGEYLYLPSHMVAHNSGNVYVGGYSGLVEYDNQGNQVWPATTMFMR